METGKIIKYAAIGAGVLLLINGMKKKERNPGANWHYREGARLMKLYNENFDTEGGDTRIQQLRKYGAEEHGLSARMSRMLGMPNPLSAAHPSPEWPRNRMLVNPYLTVPRKENADLYSRAEELAESKGLSITTYSTSSRMGGHMGYISYAAYTGSNRPYGTRSNQVVEYYQAPFQRDYHPSIKGERIAIEKLIAWLKDLPDKNPYNWRHPYGTTTKNPLYAGNYDRKPKSTNVKCNECGHTFKKIIGARTYEIKCPKCNGYDVELA